MAEIFLLINLGNHKNILSVEGVCTIPTSGDDPASSSPLLVTEYMVYGDLLHFLWESRDVRLIFYIFSWKSASYSSTSPLLCFNFLGLVYFVLTNKIKDY